jgi:hypothetical protein
MNAKGSTQQETNRRKAPHVSELRNGKQTLAAPFVNSGLFRILLGKRR